MTQDETILTVNQLGKRIGTQWLLRDISFSVGAGEILGVIGQSGAGKSTLLRCLNGLVPVSEGTVRLAGQEIAGLGEAALTTLRRKVGMVFQQFHLLASAKVLDNVALPLRMAGVARQVREKRARELLDLVGLGAHAAKYPAQLSGGQKQRVGIARALALEPVLLLCDEATSALDTETTAAILALLRDINRRLNLSIVLVTHDLAVIRAAADRVLVLDHGSLVEHGTAAAVIADPTATATQRIVAAGRFTLPEALRARLKPAHTPGAHALLRLEPRGRALQRPLLDDIARLAGQPPVLVAGGIDHVGDTGYAILFVAVPGLTEAGAAALPAQLDLRGNVEGWLDGTY